MLALGPTVDEVSGPRVPVSRLKQSACKGRQSASMTLTAFGSPLALNLRITGTTAFVMLHTHLLIPCLRLSAKSKEI